MKKLWAKYPCMALMAVFLVTGNAGNSSAATDAERKCYALANSMDTTLYGGQTCYYSCAQDGGSHGVCMSVCRSYNQSLKSLLEDYEEADCEDLIGPWIGEPLPPLDQEAI